MSKTVSELMELADKSAFSPEIRYELERAIRAVVEDAERWRVLQTMRKERVIQILQRQPMAERYQLGPWTLAEEVDEEVKDRAARTKGEPQ